MKMRDPTYRDQLHTPGLVVSPNGSVYVSVRCESDCGDLSSTPLSAPIVGAVATGNKRGYWMVGADGGVFTFGDATFCGSLGYQPANYGLNPRRHLPGLREIWLPWREQKASKPPEGDEALAASKA